ncbi:hypothetical protein JI752_001355 [Lysobacter sp. MMG2]|uniref:hypothetical protein n=1 Tax=Lysobacter sp. MMG2 TaxID=2801338 RepID=UPI001C217E63|nr:hypothetical protein [Lysobacter sp. MMG2]MBU8974778.1 hypothetical protein [Lysobacter sp. MMG2]
MTEANAEAPLRRNLGVSLLTLIASSGTLVCCVLPAVMVALGAGAALAGLVAAVPQLVWLSEHKAGVFGAAAAMLGLSGVLLWRARRLPCPSDPRLARSCARLRKASIALWWVAFACVLVGATFAFILPGLV